MARIKYDLALMRYMSLFERVTKTHPKDCFVSKKGVAVFIVEPGFLGKAIGKRAENVRKLGAMLRKKVKIVEFSPKPEEFVRNLVAPLEVKEVSMEDGEITIAGKDTKTKGLLMGRNLQNLRETEEIVQRFFPITQIKVV